MGTGFLKFIFSLQSLWGSPRLDFFFLFEMLSASPFPFLPQ